MQYIFLAIQVISAFLLIIIVSVQGKGGGLGKTWGGGGGTSFTRRGLERVIFKATFVIAFVFIFVSILQIAI